MPALAYKLEQKNDITVEEYLSGEKTSDIKYEYVDGKVYARAGASLRHNIINANIFGLFWSYQRIDNKDMRDFLRQKEKAKWQQEGQGEQYSDELC